jgi:hypothetical protein
VLPGDVTGDCKVDAADYRAARARVLADAGGARPGARGYAPLFDLDGDGRISATDLAHPRRHLFASLAADEPTATPPAAGTAGVFGSTPIRSQTPRRSAWEAMTPVVPSRLFVEAMYSPDSDRPSPPLTPPLGPLTPRIPGARHSTSASQKTS